MSDYLAAAAQALSAPEVIVRRSAEARAKATGADIDSILQAWAGGQSVASAPAAAAAAPATAETAAPAPAAAPAAPVAAEPTAPTPVVAAASTAVAVLDEPPVDETHPAAPLSDRIRVASRVGAVSGLVLALLGWLFSSQFLLARAGLFGEEGDLAVVVGVEPGRLILIAMLVSVAIGVAVAGLTRMIPSWTSPGMKLSGSAVPSIALGIILGGLVGATAGGIIAGLGTPPEIPDDPTTVPVLAAMIWALVSWAAGGWLIGALVQALGVPDGVDHGDLDEVRTVQARLIAAFGLPLLALIAILIMVLAFAFVFISFPSWSPLTGTVLAGSILAFASLSASKPNMKVGMTELVVASAGIAVVVILIYAVLQTTGAGEHHGEEEGEHSETAEEGETPDIGEVEPVEGEARIRIVF
jgi:MFS family permease